MSVTERMVESFSAETILADSGYYSEEAVREMQADECGQATGILGLAPVERTPHGRNLSDLEKAPYAPESENKVAEPMKERMARRENRDRYAQCKQPVEPVFEIIKQATGFRRFSMWGSH